MKRRIAPAALAAALMLPLVAVRTPSQAGLPAPHPGSAASRLPAVDAAALRQKLAALKGKVVVLNVWATWCPPCVKEFPALVQFERAYRTRGVTVVGLSMDDPGKAPAVVPPFLARHGAHFTVYAMKRVDPQTVIGVVDKNWGGAIPMTYVLDRSGHVRSSMMGARSLTDFQSAVQPLLRG